MSAGKIIIIAGRHYKNREAINRELDNLYKRVRITQLITLDGAFASGLARSWAQHRNIDDFRYRSTDFEEVLTIEGPDVYLLFFPGGNGTYDRLAVALHRHHPMDRMIITRDPEYDPTYTKIASASGPSKEQGL